MSRLLPIVALGLSLSVTNALAQAAPCDYYQELLIGVLCKDTVTIGLGISDNRQETVFNSPSYYLKTNYETLQTTATVTISPLSWLQVSLGSSVATQSNRFATATPAAPYRLGPCNAASANCINVGATSGWAVSSTGSQQSFASWQTLSLLGTAFDTGPGNARYVGNMFVSAGFVPGTNEDSTPSALNAKWHTEYQFAPRLNARWRLGQSDYSIVARGEMTVSYMPLDGSTVIEPALSVLISNDLWGVAIGPTIRGGKLVNHGTQIGGDSAWNTAAGVEIRTQPFRALGDTILRNLTALVDVTHSIGQANFIDSAYGNTSALVVGGSLGWHFQY